MRLMEAIHPRVAVSRDQIAEFCQKWQITRFELFGSVLRDDFDAESDIDVLVTFAPEVHLRIADLVKMEEERKSIFGRPVDLVERPLGEANPNWIRRHNILSSARLVFAI
jgi:predicted nucleotidyltransferase